MSNNPLSQAVETRRPRAGVIWLGLVAAVVLTVVAAAGVRLGRQLESRDLVAGAVWAARDCRR